MTSFKVMTWNVENLFEAGAESGPATPEEYQAKLASLAAVILELDPDVLAVQEVGSAAAFGDLAGRLLGRYPQQVLSSHPDPRGIRVGFLSKLAIEQTEHIRDYRQADDATVAGADTQGNPINIGRFSLGRGALRIQVSPRPGFTVRLVTAHLKSKLLTYPSTGKPRFFPHDEDERAKVAGLALFKRTAEAVTLRVKANDLLKGSAPRALLVMGDLNDVPNAATTQILQGPGGSEIGTRAFDRPDQGDKWRLFNLAARLAADRRFSRVHNNDPELIDHIFASEALFPGQPRAVPEVDSHVQFLEPNPSISDNPNERRGKPGSDHAPLTAVFEV